MSWSRIRRVQRVCAAATPVDRADASSSNRPSRYQPVAAHTFVQLHVNGRACEFGQGCQKNGALLRIATCKPLKQDQTREARPLGQRTPRRTHVLHNRERRTFRQQSRAHGFMFYSAVLQEWAY